MNCEIASLTSFTRNDKKDARNDIVTRFTAFVLVIKAVMGKLNTKNKTVKSFTLLEVLIALIILSIGVTTLIWAFSSGIYATGDIENVDLALNIAQANMEKIKNTPFANLQDSGPSADPNFANFNVSVNVAEDQNPMQVDVTVAWQVKGGQTSISLTTLITNY